ncbi:MAG: apolipoprotein N-acyltransferase [Spirochaetia bacterium]|nr:apolipoprotein N-acyltransferase [Spirochaetia bacterium]
MAALSLAPFNFWFCGFIMLLPLFYFLENEKYSIKNSFLLGYVFTLFLNFFIAYWLLHTITVFGHIHWTISIVIFFLYSVITSSRYIIFILLVQFWNLIVKNKNIFFYNILINRYFFWAFFWGVSEYFGWQLFHALGANHAGGDIFLIQSADLVGIYGVSIFWFLTNLLLYDIIKMIKSRKEQPVIQKFIHNKTMVFVSSLLVILHIYGYLSIQYYNSKNLSYEKRRIALIQGNTPLAFKWGESMEKQALDVLKNQEDMTEKLLQNSISENKKPELVVWSESSVPFLSFQIPGYYKDAIERIQNKYKVAMIINDVYDESPRNYYNNLWLLDKDGIAIGYYHKIELLPFGEFIPFASLFPEIYNLVPEISGFTHGKEKKILTLNSMQIIPSICYELLPPEFTLDYYNESGKKGQIIINITNDTWFGLTTENAQHMKGSSMRAIELRLPIIRATNSGISGYIDTTGEIHEPTESETKDTRLYEVPIPDKSHSLYSITGLWPFRIFLLCGSLFLLIATISHFKNTLTKTT